MGGQGPSPLGLRLDRMGVTTTHLPSLRNSLNPLQLWSAVKALLRVIRAQHPHVIHAHSAVAGVIARIAGKISQTPVVYTVHGFGFKAEAPRLIRYNAWLAEALLAAWTTRMVCVSDFERQLAHQLPMDPERVSVVHNALADVPWRSQPDAEPARVVMVARMAEPKRPDLLLQALHRLKGQGLQPAVQMLGAGPALARQQQLAQDLQLTQVEWAGDVTQVAERLAQQQIFVLLSDHEGLPISVLEAMRAGLAIVVSRLPGTEELITDGEHGLLVPNDAEAVAQALQRLLGDAALRLRLGQAARQRYLQAFQPEAMAEHIMGIYEEAPLLPTGTWPMTLPRRHRAALASQRAQRQQNQLGWTLLGSLVLVLSWGIAWALAQQGWATQDFGRTVLACALPYGVAAHLLYRAAHLPAAERGSLLLVTTALPFVLTPLGFALLQRPYSRGAVLLTFGLTLLWFWLGERWLLRQRAFKLLYWEDEQPAHMQQLMQELGGPQQKVPLQLIRWPQHWRRDPGLCPPALAVQGALTAPTQLALPQAEQDTRRRILTALKLHHIRLYSPQAVAEALTGRVPASTLDSELWQPDGNPAYDLFKRVLDLAVVLTLLPLWLPLAALVGLAVRLDSPGPALFSQWRVGLHGRAFRIFKFRSMRHEPLAAAQFAKVNDPRITRLGQFMRRSRLDEIPQLWNVLRGDMSLIGPRPEQEHFVDQFAEQIPSYPYRHLVRPGLTGWAQVQQGYAASAEATAVKLSYDLYYVTHYSLAMDLLIALKTVRIVLTGHGAR
jgi:lipopolysaccharide/colanic/teichoic acid biosynthesis glycosyltransferase/glycosyltransferase involved in cell wall biosynthesis